MYEIAKWFCGFIHMPAWVTTEKTIKDQFKHIRNRLRATAWSINVTTAVLKMIRISPMTDQNTD